MRRIVSHTGNFSEGFSGGTYDSADPIMTANQISRWQIPFRGKNAGWGTVMLNSGQNQSGSSWENEHAGVRTEAVNAAGQGSFGNHKPTD